ncbi:hypothetical protein KZ813_15865 [Sphingomonas sp. RHCKR7]|nr:hypothetical protein [Sphingomonas folli]
MVSEIAKASDRQSAVRLLASINAASSPVAAGAWGPSVVAVLHSQSRLQALDFWMRNPDYLANELLNEFEATGAQELLDLARRVFEDREPDLRRLPMIRYHFGAFEPLDNALAILRVADLVIIRRSGTPGKVQEHHYLLTMKGRAAMDTLASSAEELAWYRDRAKIVAQIAGDLGGKALKDRQYLQAEYKETELKRVIVPVTERVRARLAALLGG